MQGLTAIVAAYSGLMLFLTLSSVLWGVTACVRHVPVGTIPVSISLPFNDKAPKRRRTQAGFGGNDPVVDGEVLHVGAYCKYLGHTLAAPDGGGLRADGVHTLDHVEVSGVDGRRHKANQNVISPDLRQLLRLHPVQSNPPPTTSVNLIDRHPSHHSPLKKNA